MKRTAVLILTFVLSFVLLTTGCGQNAAASSQSSSSESSDASDAERLQLTSTMLDDIKSTYGSSLMMTVWFSVLMKELGGDASVTDVKVTSEEQYDNYSYIYHYEVDYKENYSHYTTNVKIVLEAHADPESDKGYSIEVAHVFENDKQLW